LLSFEQKKETRFELPNVINRYTIVDLKLKYDKVELLDLNGKVLFSQSDTQELTINFLNEGFYLLRLYKEKLSTTMKILVF
jgi:hypothetical protein